ncbi:MAG: TIGR01777 family protein [Bacteroidetes bacterium]|nr:TIGR01777 family protein [Bacteroidota bacterium]
MKKSLTTLRVLIAGGSGMLGRQLQHYFSLQGVEVKVLSRNAKDSLYRWDPSKKEIQTDALEEADIIINLAGANMAGGLWTRKYKKQLYDSRIGSTRLLVDTIKSCKPKNRHFIQASAVGYYPMSDAWMNEESLAGKGFLADLAADWEHEGEKVEDEYTLYSVIRLGVILKPGEGFLGKTVPPARLGLSSAFGNGKQWMSWVHIDDACNAIQWILENELSGPYNIVADEPIRNKALTAAIAKAVRRPYFLPNVPAFALRIALGDFSSELLADHRVSNKKLQTNGFHFRFKQIDAALNDLLNE